MSERRRYYRINDTVAIRYQVLDGQNFKQELHQATIGYVKQSDLRNASYCIDARLEAIARNLDKDNPLVAEALTLINRKFAITELMHHASKPESVMQWPEQEVSISGSGIAFVAESELMDDTPLKMEIILYPVNHFISVLGRVVGCRKNEDGEGYIVSVDFEGISEEDRERLIQHILKKQMENIREQKNNTNKNTSVA